MPKTSPEQLAYIELHRKLRRARGKASDYGPCVDCHGVAQQWSWRHDTDATDFNNYDPRCRRCHFKYDRPNGIPDRHRSNYEQVELIRYLLSEGETGHRIAKMTGIGRSVIYRIASGKTYRT